MPTDVALFIHSLEGGGAERVAVTLANEMVQRGYNVDLVVQRYVGTYTSTLNSQVNVVDLACRVRRLPLRLRSYLKSRQPKTMLSFMTGFNVISSLVRSRSFPSRLVLTEHNPIGPRRSTQPSWESRLKPLMPMIYRRAEAVVTVSSAMRQELIDMSIPEERVISIPNPLDLERIGLSASHPAPEHLYFASGLPVLVTAGALVPQKDHPTLLAAAAILRRRREFRLLILGEGPLRGQLIALTQELGLRDIVDFVGFVSPPWPWMARADLFVLSSLFEGWGNVLAESMALGVPVVSTNAPTGPTEILDGGRYGSLVDVGDAEGLAQAIEHALSDHPPAETLIARAAEWSVERITSRYLDVLGFPAVNES